MTQEYTIFLYVWAAIARLGRLNEAFQVIGTDRNRTFDVVFN